MLRKYDYNILIYKNGFVYKVYTEDRVSSDSYFFNCTRTGCLCFEPSLITYIVRHAKIYSVDTYYYKGIYR